MCEETTKVEGATDGQVAQLRQRKKGEEAEPPKSDYPGAKPITSGIYLEPHHLVGKLHRAHHTIQIPVYFFKWIMAQALALWSVIFWRKPVCDDDIIKIFERTSLLIVMHRDLEAEKAEKAAFNSLTGCTSEGTVSLLETRHYYVDVKHCELDLLIREPGTTYKSGKGVSTKFKSWSARYTKSRKRDVGKGTKKEEWKNQIVSFVYNGEDVVDREKILAILHHYITVSAHSKSHAMGNSLADRILLDDRVRDTLAESTWTTTALHYGLVYGTQGPLTFPRNEKNKWMGLGTVATRDSILAEWHNMSSLGADHGDTQRWTDLELPFADFLLKARDVLKRVMEKNNIPADLHEGIFLSCIMHAADHTSVFRVYWGLLFNVDPSGPPGTWYDHWESTVWRYMWVEPTLNPIWNNKIWRMYRKPFYRQLYLGLKEIDTFNFADCITASIMY